MDKIIEFSRKYKMQITAEGENDSFPRIDDIQGYYYARPVPQDVFEKLLQ